MRETLVIDADDTLWENYAYFVQGRERFLAAMTRWGFDREAVARVLSRIDRERVHELGFGSMGYREAMRRTLAWACEQAGVSPPVDAIALLDDIQQAIRSHPVEPYPGVRDTLAYLQPRYRLVLLTKGMEEEQRPKVARSGLADFFEQVRVVPDKTEDTYRALMSELAIPVARAWMVGNSPRSDINPAAAVGLGTVWIQHDQAWDYEEVPLKTNGRFHRVHAFAELKRLF